MISTKPSFPTITKSTHEPCLASKRLTNFGKGKHVLQKVFRMSNRLTHRVQNERATSISVCHCSMIDLEHSNLRQELLVLSKNEWRGKIGWSSSVKFAAITLLATVLVIVTGAAIWIRTEQQKAVAEAIGDKRRKSVLSQKSKAEIAAEKEKSARTRQSPPSSRRSPKKRGPKRLKSWKRKPKTPRSMPKRLPLMNGRRPRKCQANGRV